jgi:hypothetical protein
MSQFHTVDRGTNTLLRQFNIGMHIPFRCVLPNLLIQTRIGDQLI